MPVVDAGLKSLDGVKSFPFVQIVRVNRNQVQTLRPLGALLNLVSVEATHNELEEVLDISPKALNLRSADLSFNRISQLRGTLEGYTNLTSLKLDGNMLQSVAGIQCLNYLEVLSIRDNELSTCDGLRELKSLRQLDVSGNALHDLGDLSALSRLEVLRSADNHLKALGNLESLQALQSLDIANNHFNTLEEIQELRPLPLLKSLLVAGNPMMDAADVRLHVLNILPTLVSLDGVAASAEEKVHAFNLHGVDNQALKSIRQKFFPDGELHDGGGANLPPTASLVTFSDPKITAALLSRTDYAAVDARVLVIPPAVAAQGVAPLAEALAEGCEGDLEIARACFVWTSTNILVPGDNLWVAGVPTFSEGVETHAETLLEGISGCWVEMQAKFHCALLRAMGLTANVVYGYGKGSSFQPGSRYLTPNHAWTAVEIEGMWWLLDTARCHFKFGMQFLSPPKEFIFSHYPLETRWQLLENPVSLNDFWDLAQCSPAFFLAGLKLLGDAKSTTDSSAGFPPHVLSIAVPEGVSLYHELVGRDGQEVWPAAAAATLGMGSLEHAGGDQEGGEGGKSAPGNCTTKQLLSVFPEAGDYRIMVSAERGGKRAPVMQMLVRASECETNCAVESHMPDFRDPICLPVERPEWNMRGCALVSPEHGTLRGNSQTSIEVFCSKADRMAVAFDRANALAESRLEWLPMERGEGPSGQAGFFRVNIVVPNQAGTAIVGGAYGSEEYVPLLDFTVQEAIVAIQAASHCRAPLHAPSLDEAGVAESKELFDRLDRKGTGSISKRDFLAAIKSDEGLRKALNVTARVDMKSEAMDNFSTLFHKISVGQPGGISWPEFAAATKKEGVEGEEEELVPVEELEKDEEMVAAAVKIQAVHRGRASRKGASQP